MRSFAATGKGPNLGTSPCVGHRQENPVEVIRLARRTAESGLKCAAERATEAALIGKFYA
jgi:hypothetical protein